MYLKTDTDVLHVLTESDYMITSDQRCLYADQGDRPVDGYRSFSSVKEPCVLRILKRGVPIESPIPIGIAHYDAPEAGNDPQGTFQGRIKWDLMNDNEVVQLDQGGLVLNDNAMYYFIYKGQYPNDIPPAFAVKNNYTIMDTGSFVCMRIHQDLDLEKYINPANWDTTPPTYEVVYENVFKLYDVVYPVMALIHPFNKEQWNNPTMAGRVVQRVNPGYWNNIMYMPRSRELSKSQLALLNAWAQYLNTVS